LSTEAANRLYMKARDRVYKISPIDINVSSIIETSLQKTNEKSNNIFSIDEIRHELKITQQIIPVLESPPKWNLLEEVY
jgi:hypothetical protein